MADRKTPKDTDHDPADAAAEGPEFPTIGDPDEGDGEDQTYVGGFKTREEAEAGIRDLSTKVDDLTKRLEQTDDLRRQDRDTINRLISSTPPAGGEPASRGGGGDLSDRIKSLPDPVEKPDDFRSGVASLVNDAVESRMSQQTAETRRSQSAEQVYADFQKRNPTLAKYDPIVRQAAIDESTAISNRGGDIHRAMQTDPDGFIERVANRTRDLLKGMGIDPEAAANDAGNDDGGANAGANGGGNGDGNGANRTGGIPGGGTGAGSGGGGGGAKRKTFADELKAEKLEHGFY